MLLFVREHSVFRPIQHRIVLYTSVTILAVLPALCSLRRVTFLMTSEIGFICIRQKTWSVASIVVE